MIRQPAQMRASDKLFDPIISNSNGGESRTNEIDEQIKTT